MKTIFYILGGLSFVASIGLGLYVGGYLMLFKGVIQIIDAAKLTPVSSEGIAIGLLKIVFASFLGVVSTMFGFFISGIFVALAKKSK